jgi:hypothetical protein
MKTILAALGIFALVFYPLALSPSYAQLPQWYLAPDCRPANTDPAGYVHYLQSQGHIVLYNKVFDPKYGPYAVVVFDGPVNHTLFYPNLTYCQLNNQKTHR